MNKAVWMILISSLWLSGCGAFTEHRVGRIDDRLSACPAWPRCVSSFETSERHGIAPLTLTAEPARLGGGETGRRQDAANAHC